MEKPFMDRYIAPWTRILILTFSLIVAGLISLRVTGSFIPEKPGDTLIFQNALLLVILGSALLEHHFTKPADSLVNALTGIVTLIPVYHSAPRMAWWSIFIYCSVVLVLATICVAVSSGKQLRSRKQYIAKFTYHLAVIFGKARLLYSIIFLFGILTFYSLQSTQTIILVLFWGFFIVIWPLGIPELLSGLRKAKRGYVPIGRVNRTDWPHIVRVTLEPGVKWEQTSLKVFQRVDGIQTLVMPLFHELLGDQLAGTGLCVKPYKGHLEKIEQGYLYDIMDVDPISESEIAEALGGTSTSKLVGFVIEESAIAEIRFELWDPDICREGMLVWCKVGPERVYYQITNGATKEESFQANRHGFQIAIAAQLGILDATKGFIKHLWLPHMNEPVFAETVEFGADIQILHKDDFLFGILPCTKIRVGGPISKYIDHHTAILGVTGSGKTELAYDIIRYAVNQGIIVICN